MDFIAEQKLTSVVAIFNCNEIAQSDYVAPSQTADHLAAKAEAFGWKVVIIDGHNPTDLVAALKLRTEAMVAGTPLAIIAKTVKGWGAPSQFGLGHHGTPVPEKDLAKVLAELDQTGIDLGAGKAKPEDIKRVLRIHPPLPAPAHHAAHKAVSFSQAAEKHKLTETLATKKKLSPRRAFGLALDALGASNPNVVGLDADVKNSTYSLDFAKNHPSHFLECRIAEQNMVSVGAGPRVAIRVRLLEPPAVGGLDLGQARSVTQSQQTPGRIQGADLDFLDLDRGKAVWRQGGPRIGSSPCCHTGDPTPESSGRVGPVHPGRPERPR